jgi:hypothetical protein
MPYPLPNNIVPEGEPQSFAKQYSLSAARLRKMWITLFGSFKLTLYPQNNVDNLFNYF